MFRDVLLTSGSDSEKNTEFIHKNEYLHDFAFRNVIRKFFDIISVPIEVVSKEFDEINVPKNMNLQKFLQISVILSR